MEQYEEIKQKTFFGAIWKFLERILAQLITFVVSLVLARILSPKEYGLIAIVTVMINLMNVFVTSGYGAALIQKKDSDDRDFNTMFSFSGGLSLVLYLLLFLIAPYLAQWYKDESLIILIRVMGLRLPFAAFNSIQQAYVAKKMQYRKFFWATLGGTIASGMVGITMALLGFGVWALVGQYFINTVIGSVILYIIFPWRYKPHYENKRAMPMIRFGSSVLFASLVDAVYREIRTLVVGVKYDAEALAYYNRGEQFPQLIVLNLGTVIDGTLMPAFCLLQDDLERMRQGLKRALQIATLITTPLMFGMAVVAEPMIRILLTDKWLPAVPYLQIFCFMYTLNPMLSATNQVIKAMGAGGLYLKLEILKKTAFVVSLLAAMPMGPIAIAWASVAAMAVSCAINATATKKAIDLPITQQLGAYLPQFLTSAIMVAAIFPLQFLVGNVYLLLLTQVLMGVVMYVLVALLSKNKAFHYFWSTIKSNLRRNSNG